jgi:hypothetical protein
MRDCISDLIREKHTLKEFNNKLDERDSLNESLYFSRAYDKMHSGCVELYHDFFNEVVHSKYECEMSGEDVFKVVKNVETFIRTGELNEPFGEQAFLGKMGQLSSCIGSTYPAIDPEGFEEAKVVIKELHQELRSLGIDRKEDPVLSDFGFIMKLHTNLESYNKYGFNICKKKMETSLVVFLGKLKLVSDKYDQFRDNNKIIALIIDLLSLLSSFGLLTGLVGLGQSIVKLFPDSENLDQQTIEDIVKLVDVY